MLTLNLLKMRQQRLPEVALLLAYPLEQTKDFINLAGYGPTKTKHRVHVVRQHDICVRIYSKYRVNKITTMVK
jgi:hypothetical protein